MMNLLYLVEIERESHASLGKADMVIISHLSKTGISSVFYASLIFAMYSKNRMILFFQEPSVKNLVIRRCPADSWLKISVKGWQN